MTSPPNPPAAKPTDAEPFMLTLPDDPASGNDWYLWASVLALLVFVVFYPAINGQLLWDDDHHVGLIASVQSLRGLADIWLHTQTTPQYYPLTFTSFWLEHLIWKENTLGYHLGNMILHAGAAVLVWRLLRRLRLPGAWLAAAAWAIHPIQAESVCWMSERKNVLSGLLFFASIWFYTEYAGLAPPAKKRSPGLSADGSTLLVGNRGVAYALSLLLLILGLLAKSVVCAMPAVLLILLWWKGRKVLSRKTILPLIPFFAAGLAMSAVTIHLETAVGGNVKARGADWDLSIVQRVLIAGRGMWFYVVKLVWPQGLAFSYPRILPTVGALGATFYAIQWFYVAAVVAVLAILWVGRRRLGRGPLAAALFYAVALFPALGFINIFPMRYSFVADHFQYLAGLGLIVLAVSAVSGAIHRLSVPPAASAAIAAAFLLTLAVPAWLAAHIYQDPAALWRDTLAKNPDSWIASDNLGVALIRLGAQKQQDAQSDREQGQADAAAADAQEAKTDFDEAEGHFRHALLFRPGNYNTHNALGQLYRQTRRPQQAESELRIAVEMDEQDEPDHQLAAPYVNYASILQINHPGTDIRPWLEKVFALARLPRSKPLQLAMDRDVAEAHLIYGNYWTQAAAAHGMGDDQELADLNNALSEFEAGLRVVPGEIGQMSKMGGVYMQIGQIDRARADQARAAGRIDDAAHYENKSIQSDDRQAEQLFRAVLSQSPSHHSAYAEEGIAEIYHHRMSIARDVQMDVINCLLLSMHFSKDALQTNPNIAGAATNLAVTHVQLMQEAATAQDHQSTWPPLREKLQAMNSGDISKASAAAADAAARQASGPLPAADPRRRLFQEFHAAAEAYAAPDLAPDAARNLRGSAANLLKAVDQRDPAADAVNDAISAALCYEGAVTADEHSSEAWLKLRATADTLGRALAAHPQTAGLKPAVDQALFVLGQRRAATQPTTMPIASSSLPR